MFEVFFLHILKKVTLTEDEKKQIKTYFTSRTLLKKELLLEEGEVCNYFSFVEKGILKSYQIDDKGVEHILFFVNSFVLAILKSFLLYILFNKAQME